MSVALSILIALTTLCYSSAFDFSDIGARSQQCDNKFVKNQLITSLVCSSLIPVPIKGIQLGADSKICHGIACALRAMGCRDEAIAAEAMITAAGSSIASCGEDFGLDHELVTKLGHYVYNNDFPDLTSVKGALNSLSLCSPLIKFALSLLKIDNAVGDKLGLCGEYCQIAACGLNILAAEQAAPAIAAINDEIAKGHCSNTTEPLACASFQDEEIDGSTTPVADGTVASSHVLPTVSSMDTVPVIKTSSHSPTQVTDNQNNNERNTVTASSSASVNDSLPVWPNHVNTEMGASGHNATAVACADIQNVTCASCTLHGRECIFCADAGTCQDVNDGGWFGPLGNVKHDTIDSHTCTSWYYKQCLVKGEVMWIGAVVLAGLILLCCLVCCVCCICKCRKKRRARGYKLHLEAESDEAGVALMDDY